jgi:hypothetical protein
MTKPLPERIPVGDLFIGAVIMARRAQLLVQQPPEAAEIVHRGTLIVRYGVRYLGKPHLSVVPALIAIDYGDLLNGEAAWEFLLHRSNLYPRAEVFGYRNDGHDEMVFVKQLDLALPIDVLVYADAQATMPLAHPAALISPSDGGIAPRLLGYLPRYTSLAEWETTL